MLVLGKEQGPLFTLLIHSYFFILWHTVSAQIFLGFELDFVQFAIRNKKSLT